jgi:hypothetical protein
MFFGIHRRAVQPDTFGLHGHTHRCDDARRKGGDDEIGRRKRFSFSVIVCGCVRDKLSLAGSVDGFTPKLTAIDE